MLFVTLLMLTSSADAQRKKKTVRQPAPTPEELKQKEKMDRMIANTAQVMFIDSFVVNKADFLSRYVQPGSASMDAEDEGGQFHLVQQRQQSGQHKESLARFRSV